MSGDGTTQLSWCDSVPDFLWKLPSFQGAHISKAMYMVMVSPHLSCCCICLQNSSQKLQMSLLHLPCCLSLLCSQDWRATPVTQAQPCWGKSPSVRSAQKWPLLPSQRKLKAGSRSQNKRRKPFWVPAKCKVLDMNVSFYHYTLTEGRSFTPALRGKKMEVPERLLFSGSHFSWGDMNNPFTLDRRLTKRPKTQFHSM